MYCQYVTQGQFKYSGKYSDSNQTQIGIHSIDCHIWYKRVVQEGWMSNDIPRIQANFSALRRALQNHGLILLKKLQFHVILYQV